MQIRKNPIEEFKTRASTLLKQLRSEDPAIAGKAYARFTKLPGLTPITAEELSGIEKTLHHKHALAVIAAEEGYPSWAVLKKCNSTVTLFKPKVAGFPNRWFDTYEEANNSLHQDGGFLFPHGKQFFICTAEFIRALGVDPDDPDWEAIGYDWFQPADEPAYQRLHAQFRELDLL
jgi:hypothetical protein